MPGWDAKYPLPGDENEKDISEISQWKIQYSPYEAVPRI